jgi:hypothetical protein
MQNVLTCFLDKDLRNALAVQLLPAIFADGFQAVQALAPEDSTAYSRCICRGDG